MGNNWSYDKFKLEDGPDRDDKPTCQHNEDYVIAHKNGKWECANCGAVFDKRGVKIEKYK